jgi:hypothetical protein
MDLDLPSPQRGSNLESDEACADDNGVIAAAARDP